MAFNPMMLMQLKSKLDGFNNRHPKLKMFFANEFTRIGENDILELSVTKADGTKKRTNFRVTIEDIQLIQDLAELVKSQGK